MRTALKRPSYFLQRGMALLLMLVILAGCVPICAETAGGSAIDELTGETQETLARAALQKWKQKDQDLEGIVIRQNGQIHGRGISDDPSGEEPDYVGLIGYAAARYEDIVPEKDGISLPWTVPAYLLFEKKWYYSMPMQHKTGVLVIKQVLKEKGSGRYTGRLKVIRLDTGETCWMNVENFITVPYWFYPARRSVRYGCTVAVYRRQGNRFPTDVDGNPAEVADDTDVMIPGNGPGEAKVPDGSRMIPGIICREKITVTETTEAAEGTAEETGEAEVTKVTERREIISTVLLFPEEDLITIY